MVGFGLDYACAHIIILAEISSENLLPIRADFVTERDTMSVRNRQHGEQDQEPYWHYVSNCVQRNFYVRLHL